MSVLGLTQGVKGAAVHGGGIFWVKKKRDDLLRRLSHGQTLQLLCQRRHSLSAETLTHSLRLSLHTSAINLQNTHFLLQLHGAIITNNTIHAVKL